MTGEVCERIGPWTGVQSGQRMDITSIRLESSAESTRGQVNIGGGAVSKRERHATGG